MKRFLAISALAGLAGCGSIGQSPAAGDAGVRLYTMDCGRFSLPSADMFADDGSFKDIAVELANPCYLIRHSDGDLVWDTGLPASIVENPSAGTAVARTLEDQLEEIGLTPADVEYLSFSHSHYDHVGGGNLFTGGTWIVDPDERAWMLREQVRGTPIFASYGELESANTILIEGDGPYDVFGDGTVVIHQTPGHTPGHAVLMLQLANAGPVLISGDMWHTEMSRAARSVPRVNTDREQTLASIDKLEAMIAETDARVVRQHVLSDFEAMPQFPGYLD